MIQESRVTLVYKLKFEGLAIVLPKRLQVIAFELVLKRNQKLDKNFTSLFKCGCGNRQLWSWTIPNIFNQLFSNHPLAWMIWKLHHYSDSYIKWYNVFFREIDFAMTTIKLKKNILKYSVLPIKHTRMNNFCMFDLYIRSLTFT